MLGSEIEDLVIQIMSGTPLDYGAKIQAENHARELLALVEQTIKMLQANKDVLKNPHVQKALGVSVLKLNSDIADALLESANIKAYSTDDTFILTDRVCNEKEEEEKEVAQKSPAKKKPRRCPYCDQHPYECICDD